MVHAPVRSPVNVEARKNLGIKPGDTVRVQQKIQEKGKTRLQAFEGLVLAVKHGTEAGGTFTVRKVASGVGVEKIFPLYSPMIDSIEIVKRTRVRRAKLYYIREKAAKEIRRAMRNAFMVGVSTNDVAVAAVETPNSPEEVAEALQSTVDEVQDAPSPDPDTTGGGAAGSAETAEKA